MLFGMTTNEIAALAKSVNERRHTVSPVHNPAEHEKLLSDYNKLVDAGYQLNFVTEEWEKAA